MAHTKPRSRGEKALNSATMRRGLSSEQFHHSTKSQKKLESKQRANQRKVKANPQKAAVGNAEDEDEDELGLRPRPTKPAPVRRVKPKKILDILKAAASYLGGIGSLEDVEVWLEKHGINEEEPLQELRKACKTIADLLGVRNSSAADASQHVSGALAKLGQFYIYRNGSKAVGLLAPVELFEAAKNYQPRKGFGFVRKTGTYFPMVFAISGYSNSLEATEKLLDSMFWTRELMEFGKHYKFRFKPDGWDGVHDQEVGTDHASHAETQLMLAWSYAILGKATGSKPSFETLHLIRGVETQRNAEIALNDNPCAGCRKFQKVLEMITGIKFTFIVLPSLGNMVAERNVRGRKMWRTQVRVELEENQEVDQENVEEEFQEEYAHVSAPLHRQLEHFRKSKIEIVLPSRNVSQMEDIRAAVNGYSQTEEEEEEEEEIMVSARVKVSQRHIDFEEYYHTPQSRIHQRRQRTYGNESDNDEYEPPAPSRSRRRDNDMTTPTKNIVTRNGLATPPSAEFGQDALQFVRKINKKRKSPMETLHSIPVSKKSKLSKD